MNKTVLIVEDEESDVYLTIRALKKNNVVAETVVAEDGQQALDYLFGQGAHAGRDTSVQPALVLLDLNLPRVPGLEVLRRIREDQRTKLVPVVILTSSDSERDMADSSALGANRYIQKPIGYAEFVEMIRQVAEDWLD